MMMMNRSILNLYRFFNKEKKTFVYLCLVFYVLEWYYNNKKIQ